VNTIMHVYAATKPRKHACWLQVGTTTDQETWGQIHKEIFYVLSYSYCNFLVSRIFLNVFFSKIHCNFVLQET